MKGKKTYTSSYVAKRLQMSRASVHNWSSRYSKYLSKGANPGDGSDREYTTDDINLLTTILHLRRVERLPFDQIKELLESGGLETLQSARNAFSELSVGSAPIDAHRPAAATVAALRGEIAVLRERIAMQEQMIEILREQIELLKSLLER